MTVMPSPTTFLVIQHEQAAPAALFGQWWSEVGVQVEVCRGDLGHPVPDTLDMNRYAALVVLGGYMGAEDDHSYDWLAPTKSLIREAIARDTPLLGICLGHQLAASALGGRVGRNPSGRTLGPTRVSLTDAGRTDPLLAGTDGQLALHYNDDVVLESPSGATVLAHSPDGHIQALRLGPCAWGVQFHPECPPAVLEEWLAGDSATASPQDHAAVATAYENEHQLVETWKPVAHRFAELSRSSIGSGGSRSQDWPARTDQVGSRG